MVTDLGGFWFAFGVLEFALRYGVNQGGLVDFFLHHFAMLKKKSDWGRQLRVDKFFINLLLLHSLPLSFSLPFRRGVTSTFPKTSRSLSFLSLCRGGGVSTPKEVEGSLPQEKFLRRGNFLLQKCVLETDSGGKKNERTTGSLWWLALAISPGVLLRRGFAEKNCLKHLPCT